MSFSSKNSIVVVFLLFITKAQAYADILLTARISESPAAEGWNSSLIVCISKDAITCFDHGWQILPWRLEEEGKDGVRLWKRIAVPWLGEQMVLLVREKESGVKEHFNISDLSPRGKATAHFTTFEAVNLEFKIRCSMHFHGELCTQGCQPKRNHHNCSFDGEYLCLNGRTGEVCQHVPIAAAAATAAPLTSEQPMQHSPALYMGLSLMSMLIILVIYSVRRRAQRSHYKAAHRFEIVE